MTLKIHPTIATIIIAALIILLFLLIKGCSNSQQALTLNKELKIKNDSLASKVIREKTENLENKKEYDTKLEVVNGQVEIKNNQLARTEVDLDAANKRINTLIANHKTIVPDSDSSNTYVPNDFITDCNGCFTELSNGQKLVQQYKSDNEQLKLSLRIKEKLQTDRIAQQELEKEQLSRSLNNCMLVAKAALKTDKPKGQLYFSWGVQFAPLPKMAAVGLLYQNKHKLIYGAKGWFGVYGTMVEANMNMPLSFKKRLF